MIIYTFVQNKKVFMLEISRDLAFIFMTKSQ